MSIQYRIMDEHDKIVEETLQEVVWNLSANGMSSKQIAAVLKLDEEDVTNWIEEYSEILMLNELIE